MNEMVTKMVRADLTAPRRMEMIMEIIDDYFSLWVIVRRFSTLFTTRCKKPQRTIQLP